MRVERIKTWDGTRWLFLLFALAFAAITAWLVHEGTLHHEAVLLLVVPAGFSASCGALALFASDDLLQPIARLFLVWH